MGRVTGSQEMSPCRESLVRITQILMEALTAAGAGPPVEHEGRLRAPHPSVGTARPLEAGEECARLCQDGAPPFLESEILSGEVRHDVANDVTSCNPPRVPPVGPSNSGHRPRPLRKLGQFKIWLCGYECLVQGFIQKVASGTSLVV